MSKNYGPATWWLTLSPNEWLWTEEFKPFMEVFNPDWKDRKMTETEMASKDPVGTAVFLEHKFEATLKFMMSDDNPIGKIDHYFVRREYQGRGMPHFHMIIWIKDAPMIGETEE